MFILSWYWKSFLKTQPNKDVYCLDSWDNFKTKRKFEKIPVSSCILYLVYIMLIVCCVSGCLKYTANMLKVLPLVISYWAAVTRKHLCQWAVTIHRARCWFFRKSTEKIYEKGNYISALPFQQYNWFTTLTYESKIFLASNSKQIFLIGQSLQNFVCFRDISVNTELIFEVNCNTCRLCFSFLSSFLAVSSRQRF